MEAKHLNFKKIDQLRKKAGITLDEFSAGVGYKSRQGYAKAINEGTISAIGLVKCATMLELDFYKFIELLDMDSKASKEDRAAFFRRRSLVDAESPLVLLEMLYQKREILEKVLRANEAETRQK